MEAERALADLLGGFEGGWAFWTAALAALEIAINRSRDHENAFCSWPKGELDRFARDVDDALRLAALAVDVQLLLNGEPDGRGDARRETLHEILARRVREVREAYTLPEPPT